MTSGLWISTLLASVLAGSGDVATQRVDNARTGAVLTETVLTPASVPGHLERVYERRIDGQTLANPLYVEGVQVASGARKNLFFMATATNCVYAFDLADHRPDSAPDVPAGHCDTSARAVWHRDVGATADVWICPETRPPRVGVTSTPVIDAASNAMFLVSFHADDHQHYLHKLDLRTGADLHAPVRIGGTASRKVFDAACQRNRPGLLLQKGVVYISFATFSCDKSCPTGPYRGWLFGYRASDLAPMGALTTAPTGGGAGIWQSGNGIVGDGSSLYFETGNDLVPTPLGDSFVRVDVSGSQLSVHGHFEPANRERLRLADTDLGSGGPVLLPGGKLLGGGKEGRLYLVDSAMRGKADQQWLAFHNTWHDDPTQPVCDLTHIGHTLPPDGCFVPHDRYQDSEHWSPNIHGGPLYWKSTATSSFGYVYLMPEKEYLRQYRYNLRTFKIETTPFHSSTERTPDGMPGGAISLSANGGRNGIVWALIANSDAQSVTAPGHMVAFRADLLTELWRDDDPVAFAKFNPPLAVAGHVIRPTFADRVIVYAQDAPGAGQAAGKFAFRRQPVQPLLDVRAAPLPCYSIAEKIQVLGGATGILGRAMSEEINLQDGAGGKVRYFAGVETLGATCDAPEELEVSPVLTAIYWSAKSCAHVLRGEALALWEQLGAEAGPLGYPLTDEIPTREGRRILFEHGEIRWTPMTGYEVREGS
jgi:hypothetical protein